MSDDVKKSRVIEMKEEWISQQGSKDERCVHLKPGDIVELREDGIYFTRKIVINKDNPDINWESVFEAFRYKSL